MTPQPGRPDDQPAPSRGRPRELTLTVGAPAHGGHCVARPVDDPDGRVIFVRHALPGETVRARLTEMTSRTWRADAVEVLQASPDRVESVWPEAGPAGVGGGELAHVALDAQRTWKRWVLADCLRRIGGQEVADAV
ncbi:SAM-dependent methyltransferase, partial [Actinomyces naeslundii]|uniref:TRAM domain-containing protein n=1 Tax=Actinomyces naeslundii TaxID=1655 RepID=UPI00097A5BA3